jgi:hypothetical protein
MATAALHLRSATRASRDIRAALFGLLLVPIIIIALLLGTLAAGVPADTAPGPYEGAAALDR